MRLYIYKRARNKSANKYSQIRANDRSSPGYYRSRNRPKFRSKERPTRVAIVGDDSVAKKGEGEGISAGPRGLIAPVDLSAARRRKGRDGWKWQNAR